MTDKYGFEMLHKVLLSAMKDIDRICREHGLKYYLYAGTLLGAMNFKGFIPWDDDVDISLTPSDYKKLVEIIEKNYSDKYRIETYENTPNHYSPLNKLRILGTELRYENGVTTGAFIDISVFHGMPRAKLAQKRQFFDLKVLSLISAVKSGAVIPTSAVSKLVLKPLSKVSKKQLWKMLDSVMCRHDNKSVDYYNLVVNTVPNPYTGMDAYHTDKVPCEICREPKYIPFEDTEFMVYSDPERDLVHRYGPDWHKPYPEEKRTSKHCVSSYVLSDEVKRRIGVYE